MSSEAKKSDLGQHNPNEKKSSDSHSAPLKTSQGGKPQQQGSMPGGCQAWGCKKGEQQFSFCHEHFEHFKFGLIKKNGEPVPDYEKKFEHFQAWKVKQRSPHKVA